MSSSASDSAGSRPATRLLVDDRQHLRFQFELGLFLPTVTISMRFTHRCGSEAGRRTRGESAPPTPSTSPAARSHRHPHLKPRQQAVYAEHQSRPAQRAMPDRRTATQQVERPVIERDMAGVDVAEFVTRQSTRVDPQATFGRDIDSENSHAPGVDLGIRGGELAATGGPLQGRRQWAGLGRSDQHHDVRDTGNLCRRRPREQPTDVDYDDPVEGVEQLPPSSRPVQRSRDPPRVALRGDDTELAKPFAHRRPDRVGTRPRTVLGRTGRGPHTNPAATHPTGPPRPAWTCSPVAAADAASTNAVEVAPPEALIEPTAITHVTAALRHEPTPNHQMPPTARPAPPTRVLPPARPSTPGRRRRTTRRPTPQPG